MRSFGLLLFLAFQIFDISIGAPTLNHVPDSDSVIRLIDAAADDISSIAVAKAAAVGFAGGVAMNTVKNSLPNVNDIYKTVADGSNAALKTASKAGKDSWNYVRDVSSNAAKAVEENVETAANAVAQNVQAVRDVDPMEVLNETESAILSKNEAILKAVFDAKRKAFLALQDLSQITGDFTSQGLDITNQNVQNLLDTTVSQWEAMNTSLQMFWNTTLDNLSTALTNTQSGMQVSKENIANIYNTITLENAQHVAQGAIDNVQNAASVAQDTINTGIDNTITITGNATSAVINSLVEAKSGIQDAAENFDSKSIIKTTKKRIGNAIVGTIEGAGNLLEQAGVYSAIDSIVHGFAGMPTKINSVLEEAQDTISNSSVVFEFIWEDQNKEQEGALTRSGSLIEDLADDTGDDDVLGEELDITGNRKEVSDDLDKREHDDKVDENIEPYDEIKAVEDEVEDIEQPSDEKDTLEGESKLEDQIRIKTKEILDLMENIPEENNAIIR